MKVMTWVSVNESQIDLPGVRCHWRPRDITGWEAMHILVDYITCILVGCGPQTSIFVVFLLHPSKAT